MRTRLTVLLVAAVLVGLAGCGKSSSSSKSASKSTTTSEAMMETHATCSPAGTMLKVTAKDTKFDADCLAAPAGQAFTIDLDNKDSVGHTVSIYSADPADHPDAKQLFKGDVFSGPGTHTYHVGALAAGTYHFHCDVHPSQMFGNFIVK